RFAIDSAESKRITFLRELADLFRGQARVVSIVGGNLLHEPRCHGRARGEGFPTSAKPAGTEWARRINGLVPEFGMSAPDTSIQLAIENNRAADPGADCDVNQARLPFPGSPGRFGERAGVGIVFDRHLHSECCCQIGYGILVAP